MRALAASPSLRPDPALIGVTPSPVRLSLPAHARNIAVVRRALEAIAEELALPRRLIDDMRLAVTEACTNVVRHAYATGGAEDASAMRVELLPGERGMQVIVEDRGRGLGSGPNAHGLGLGLPLIGALTSHLEMSPGADDRGSRIAMWFTPVSIEAA